MKPEISVIIPHHGDLAALQICLMALDRCDDRARAEVIVALNTADAVPADFTKSHPCVHFTLEPRQGAAFARNAGASLATSDTFFFLDSDCLPAPDALVMAMHASDTADLSGGAVVATVPMGQALSSAQAFELVFAFDQQKYIQRKGFSVTACLIARRSVFETIGGFHHGGSEDVDWCHRATAAGFTLKYAPDLRVSHPCRPSWGALRQKWRRLTEQSYRLRAHSRPAWIAKAALMPLSILAHAPRILTTSTLPNPRDKMSALAMLARLRLWRMGEMLRLSMQPRL